MNREDWVEQVGRGFARMMPDQFPEGYAYWLAEKKADEGAYDAYLAGEFHVGSLYEPDPRWF